MAETKIIEKDNSVVLEAEGKTFEFPCISADDIQDLGMSDWREEDMKERIIDKIDDELEAAEVKITDDTFDELVKKLYEMDEAIWSSVGM